MDITDIILLLFVGAGASFVQRVSGFGLAIFAMLFLPHFLSSPIAAASISNMFSCATSSYNSIKYRKNISFIIVLPMLISALITIPFAVYLSNHITVKSFTAVLGIVLIILSLYFIIFGNKVKFKPTKFKGVISGIGSGLLNGLFSTGGPPAVIYLNNVAENKKIYFACMQFFFAVTNIYAVAFRFLNGFITSQVIIYLLIGLIGCFVGDYIGKKIFNKLDGDKIKSIVYIAMLSSGILMIIK